AFTSYAARPPAPGDTVMLLLGNSATDRGFDPTTIEQAIGDPHLRIYNFGLKGARLDDQFGLIEHVIARGIKPTHVMLGIKTYLDEFDHRGPDDYPMVERLPEFVDWLATRGIRAHVVLLPMAASGTSRVAEYDAVTSYLRAKAPPGTLDLTHDPARFTDDVF